MSDFSLFGRGLFSDISEERTGVLAEKFIFPPFSILSAQSGPWKKRKRAWERFGIKGELGREAKTYNIQGWADKTGITGSKTDTSIFDPVLCEIMYEWFCPPKGQIVDPFAGGSVRGIVAGLLGYKYHGIDLSAEQILANEEQRLTIAPDAQIAWKCGDSLALLNDAPKADFIFSCPPYGNLERYSDDPLDLSTMIYSEFLVAYKRIIQKCINILKPGGMACFVVGDFRNKKNGNYYGFVADTVKVFQECGAGIYNEAILVTSPGTLPVRVTKQFEKSRKLGKMHQNILIFCKNEEVKK